MFSCPAHNGSKVKDLTLRVQVNYYRFTASKLRAPTLQLMEEELERSLHAE